MFVEQAALPDELEAEVAARFVAFRVGKDVGDHPVDASCDTSELYRKSVHAPRECHVEVRETVGKRIGLQIVNSDAAILVLVVGPTAKLV